MFSVLHSNYKLVDSLVNLTSLAHIHVVWNDSVLVFEKYFLEGAKGKGAGGGLTAYIFMASEGVIQNESDLKKSNAKTQIKT